MLLNQHPVLRRLDVEHGRHVDCGCGSLVHQRALWTTSGLYGGRARVEGCCKGAICLCACALRLSCHCAALCCLVLCCVMPCCVVPCCSYDISTIASVIPAFASRQDILVIDDGVSYPIQQVKRRTAAVCRGAHAQQTHVHATAHSCAAQCRAQPVGDGGVLCMWRPAPASRRDTCCPSLLAPQVVHLHAGHLTTLLPLSLPPAPPRAPS
jgi:hypothetical protein